MIELSPDLWENIFLTTLSLSISSLPQVIEQSLFLFVPGRKAQTFPEPRIPPSPLRRSKGRNVVQQVSGTQIFTRSSSQLTPEGRGDNSDSPKNDYGKEVPDVCKTLRERRNWGGGEIIFTLYPDGIVMIAACSPSLMRSPSSPGPQPNQSSWIIDGQLGAAAPGNRGY